MWKNTGNLDKEEVHNEIGCMYEEVKTEGWPRWNIVVFLGIRFLAPIFLVTLNMYPYVQVGSYFAFNVAALAWAIVVRPQKYKLSLISEISSDVAAVISNGVYFKLCDGDLSEETVERYGDIVLYTYVFVSLLNVILSMVRSILDFVEWYKKRKLEKANESYVSSTTMNVADGKDPAKEHAKVPPSLEHPNITEMKDCSPSGATVEKTKVRVDNFMMGMKN